MELNIIKGKAGSGKSTYLFQKVKEIIDKNSKIYIITPEQFSFTAEKKLLEELQRNSAINAEVLTFSRMAYRVINENGKSLKNIEGFGKSMLIYNILEDTKKELQFLGKNMQNIEVIERSITEFKKHNITKEKLQSITEKLDDEYLKAKLEDMSKIYTKFQEKIEEKFLDEDDTLTYLARNIQNTKMFCNSVILIDEFVRFYSTRIQRYRRTTQSIR
ncbi:MAG: hypothetical protein HFJ52_05920 [Clostridia bacterium]|nr:hypothetical protein [Clostridia bacterium]